MSVVSAVKWVTVNSGLFAAAAYRKEMQQMYLRFHGGDVYRYFDCPLPVYREFLAAESKGGYFSRKIRNRFRHELIHRDRTLGEQESANACLAEQLGRSIVLAQWRAVQKRKTVQA